MALIVLQGVSSLQTLPLSAGCCSGIYLNQQTHFYDTSHTMVRQRPPLSSPTLFEGLGTNEDRQLIVKFNDKSTKLGRWYLAE